MCVITNLLKVTSKRKPKILWKVIANGKGTNRFRKESQQLVYELRYQLINELTGRGGCSMVGTRGNGVTFPHLILVWEGVATPFCTSNFS